MSIVAAYLDYKSAAIEIREIFSFTSGRIREILRNIKKESGISGAVLLSTCNRTELYISSRNADKINPAQILCQQAGIANENLLLPLFNIKHGNEAILHLMEVACGLQSMVLCEDQIITQVNEAILTAREEKVSDSELETLFRLGVTAAKKAKTQVKIKAVPRSAAENAIAELSKQYSLKDKKVLVIGNGEIGRLCCEKLIELGSRVTITLRTYKHGNTIVPHGCSTIPYDERAEFMSKVDVVISATASPHFTITYDMVKRLSKKPGLFVDLALPRDIEPRVSEIKETCFYNLDMFSIDYTEFNLKEINEIKEIINHYNLQYEKWNSFHTTGKSLIGGSSNLKIYVVGIGPGEDCQITGKALQALEDSQLIVGYNVYVDLIRHLIPGKETLTTPMKKEVDRCKMAVEAAMSGKKVAVISSGDAGIYGMAGLIYEVLSEYNTGNVAVEVIPGITAASSAAAVLGAPLTHDFAVISLSDLLTPWEAIENRLRLAAQAGFTICIYNPSSKKRGDYLKKACEIIMEVSDKRTPCGYVKNIGREGQTHKLMTLGELAQEQVDMFTTVVIGSKNTRIIDGKLVTSRGYNI